MFSLIKNLFELESVQQKEYFMNTNLNRKNHIIIMILSFALLYLICTKTIRIFELIFIFQLHILLNIT